MYHDILVQLSDLGLAKAVLVGDVGEPTRGEPSSPLLLVSDVAMAIFDVVLGELGEETNSPDVEVVSEGAPPVCSTPFSGRDGKRPTRKHKQVVWSILPGNST